MRIINYTNKNNKENIKSWQCTAIKKQYNLLKIDYAADKTLSYKER